MDVLLFNNISRVFGPGHDRIILPSDSDVGPVRPVEVRYITLIFLNEEGDRSCSLEKLICVLPEKIRLEVGLPTVVCQARQVP